MSESINFMNTEGLKFFGKVNASISHELKNILAIISETSGFLNDLTDLAKQGKELKLSLIENCNDSIAEEIQRGFTTIKQMNQFAHIVDVPIKETDPLEILTLTIKLSEFLSFASKVKINSSDEEITSVLTCPFLLQNLIYQVLLCIYDSIGPDEDLHIQLDSQKAGARLIFSSPAELVSEYFPTQKIQKSVDILGVELNKNAYPRTIDIWIPSVSDEIIVLAKELKIDLYTENNESSISNNH